MEILELHSTRVPSVKSDGTRKAISDPLNSIFFSCQAKNFSMLRAISNCCDKDTPQKHWWSFYSETGLYLLKKHFSLTENMKICNCDRWSYCKKSHTMNCYIHKNCVLLQMIVQEAESAHPGHVSKEHRCSNVSFQIQCSLYWQSLHLYPLFVSVGLLTQWGTIQALFSPLQGTR